MAALPPFTSASRHLIPLRSTSTRSILSSRPSFLLMPLVYPSSIQKRCATVQSQSEKATDRMYQSITSRDLQPSQRTGFMTGQQVTDEVAHFLLPHTFVTPPWSKRPSILSEPRDRLKFEYVRLKCRVQDIVTRVIGTIWYKDKFFFPEVIPTAEALHRNMYTAFARGDTETLSRICDRDLYNTFRARILARPNNVKFAWNFSGYNVKSRVASHKVGLLSMVKSSDEDSSRQVVVRIDSNQSLTKGINGKVVKGTGEVERHVEYLVITKRRKKGELNLPWVVWGTVEEGTMEDINNYGKNPTVK